MLLDSVHVSYWSSSDNEWVKSYSVYAYDSSGNRTEYFEHSWSSDSNDWVNSYHSVYSYDINGNRTEYYSYRWIPDSNDWGNSYYYVYTYDTTGNQTEYCSYHWDLDSSDWVNSNHYVYTYDTSGNQTEYYIYYWNPDSNNWVNSYHYVSTYDASGNRTENYRYRWNTESNNWEDSYHSVYTYDIAGNPTEYYSYRWDSYYNVWVESYHNVYIYDSNVNRTEYFSYYWDSYNNVWVNSYREVYTYDDLGNRTEYHDYYWDSGTNDWVDYCNIVYSYLPVEGKHLGIRPSNIDFGIGEVEGISSSAKVMLYNVGTDTLTISSISPPDSIFTLNNLPSLPLVVPPGFSETFDIIFSPLGITTYVDTIIISSNDEDKSEKKITLFGTGIIIMPADSGVFYATTASPDSDQLLTIDPSSGEGIQVGLFGQDNLYGLAINSKGVIYSTDYNNGDLFRIDAVTGTAIFEVSTRLKEISAMAFDTADVLFAVSGSHLYIIDLASGFSKPVGSLEDDINDLVYDPKMGMLWGVAGDGSLLKIDPESATVIRPGKEGSNKIYTGVTVDAAGNLFALDFGEDGKGKLVLINKTNGTASLIGEVGIPNTFSLECYYVPIQGKHVYVIPDSLNYGKIEAGKTDTLQIVISNNGNDPVSITGLVTPDSIFEVLQNLTPPFIVQPGTSEYINVVFSPADSILYSDTIKILTDLTVNETRSIILSGQGIIIMNADSGMCYASTGSADGGRLLRIDPATGMGSLVGPTGLDEVLSIAINSAGQIYGTDKYSGELYRIDAGTGMTLYVSSTDLYRIDALAFSSSDILYAIGSSYLYTINPVSGESNQIGYTGSFTGIAFDPMDGRLLGIRSSGSLYWINTETGQSNYIGSGGISGSHYDLGFDFAGNLYSVLYNYYLYKYELISIDKNTGEGSVIGEIGFQGVSGLAFYNVPIEGKQIRVIPASLDFGDLEVNNSSETRIITISNIGTEDLILDSISNSGESISITGLPSFPAVLESGLSLSLTVTFMPENCGPISDSLVIYSDDTEVEARIITLAGRGISDDCPIVVNSTGDTEDLYSWDGKCDDGEGDCTLRAALQESNSRPGKQTIAFNIPGDGPHTIQPSYPLPAIIDAVVIDGTTEPDFTGTPVIEINGNDAGKDAIGFILRSTNNTIQGLAINRFGYYGIQIMEGGNTIRGNYIGTDISGMKDLGNLNYGVNIRSSGNVIGGKNETERNVISGNENDGILIESGTYNIVKGNYIGTNAKGNAALGNSAAGIYILTSNNTIGGTDVSARNVISGNPDGGIILCQFDDIPVKGNIIQGNLIGTDATGTVALGNVNGVEIASGASKNLIGGTTPGTGNIISGNNGYGVMLLFHEGSAPTENLIQGNYIGADITGTLPLPNTDAGVFIENASNTIVGGVDSNATNTIAFNGSKAIIVQSGTGNAILSNSIYSNTELGIDLLDDGFTNNDMGDSDVGSNNLQNFPDINRAGITNKGEFLVAYRVNSDTINSKYPLTIQFFKAENGNEGKAFLGENEYRTIDYLAGLKASYLGNAGDLGIQEGDIIVATATDAENNTSEFSMGEAVILTVGVGTYETVSGSIQSYPNPFSTETIIRFPNSRNDKYMLSVRDLNGRTVKIDDNIMCDEFVLKRDGLPGGLYLLELRGPNTYRGKILIE
ncbi:choice-of-anchor D domain-containing protein [Bacteroidota bacterium]